MVIGLLRVRIHIHDADSLKDKRSVLKRLIHRLRVNHNCAVSEIEDHDVWRSAVLGLVTVYHEKRLVDSLFRHLVGVLEEGDGYDLIDEQIEYL